MRIIFKGMERSELIRQIVTERLASVFLRFPELESSQPLVVLGMQNSPRQAGPDVFTVKFCCQSGRYKNVVLEKSAINFYAALADLLEHLQERLNRFGERSRARQRTMARRFRHQLEQMERSATHEKNGA